MNEDEAMRQELIEKCVDVMRNEMRVFSLDWDSRYPSGMTNMERAYAWGVIMDESDEQSEAMSVMRWRYLREVEGVSDDIIPPKILKLIA